MPLRKHTDEPDSCEKEEETDGPASLLRLLNRLIQPQTVSEICGSSSFVFNKPDENTAGQIVYTYLSGFLFTYII